MIITFIILSIAFFILLMLIDLLLKQKDRSRLYKHFICLNSLFCIHILGLILQILFKNTSVSPIYFEYITYIGAMYTAVEFMIIALILGNKNIDSKKYTWLYILPTILLVSLWTNDLHHLFYITYSINFANTVYGPLLYVYMVYSYTLMLVSFVIISRYTIKKSGFFSLQTLLILLGVLVPIVTNVLGALRIVNSNVYMMPITFTVTAICFYIAIIKLKALNIIPVTLRTVIDNMSDGFVVISEDGTIADLNNTFLKKFGELKEFKNKDNLFEVLSKSDIVDFNMFKSHIKEAKDKNGIITKEYHLVKGTYDKYFEIDFQPVKSKDGKENVATMLLIRDITQAKRDMEIMMKNESLVMLGELAGGVAHDINTPISAIKSGLLIFKDIVKSEDEKMLLERMDSCANKIVTLTNSLRNQIRNIGSDVVSDVSITTVVTDLAVIIHNELTKHKVKLNTEIKDELVIKGNQAKLSQVVTNIVINAIQAYEERGGEVNIKVYEDNNNAVISVEDFAGGIPEYIKENIGKNILTTKGVSGTGFGLYMAYSVIYGSFGGNIYFDTKDGVGTTFYITIPISKEVIK